MLLTSGLKNCISLALSNFRLKVFSKSEHDKNPVCHHLTCNVFLLQNQETECIQRKHNFQPLQDGHLSNLESGHSNTAISRQFYNI